MDKQEMEQWAAETKLSETAWRPDRVAMKNRGGFFFYKGGENGNYVEVTKDGVASVGRYEGAVPHIGEAMFVPEYSQKLADNAGEAFDRLIELLGGAIAISILT